MIGLTRVPPALLLVAALTIPALAAGPASQEVEGHYGEGNRLQRLRDYEQAIGAYRSALAIDPNHVPSRHQLGIACLKSGKLEQAVRAQQLVVQQDPAFLDGHLDLGRAYVAWLDDRVSRLYAGITATSENQDDHFHHGLFLKSIRKELEAIAALERALQLQPDHTLALRELSTLYFDTQQYDQCIRVAVRSVELGVSSRNTLAHLGEAYLRSGRYDDAIELMQRAVRVGPDFLEGYLTLARAYERQGELDRAASAYRRALAVEPDRKETHYSLAGLHRRREDEQGFEREMTLFEQLQIDTELPPELQIEVLESRVLRNPLDIRVAFRELALLHGALGDAARRDRYGERVEVWEVKRRLDPAVAALRKVFELRPSPEVRGLFDEVSAFRRRYEDGVNRAAGYDLEAARDLAAAARRSHDAGDLDEALVGYKRALLNDPGNVDADHGLVEIYCAHRFNLTLALELAEKAINLDASPSSYHWLAEVYRRRGNHTMAAELVEASKLFSETEH